MDDVDIKIIQELLSNSRMTYRELADRLDLSVNSAHKRVQSLVEQGVVQRFTLHLTPKVLPQVWVRVCGKSATVLMDETVERLGANQNTSMVAVSSGNMLHILGVLRDYAEVNKFVNFAIKTGEIADPDIRLPNPPHFQGTAEVSLTRTDYRILASLQENCRKQIVDMAAELCISAKTVRRRLSGMEKGEAVHYRINFDHALLGGVFTLLDLYVNKGVDPQEVIALINRKYAKNLMGVRTFSTLPNEITIDVWTRSLAELKTLQDSLQREGSFSRIVPIMVYHATYFETWREQHVRDHARYDRPNP
ncbi:MAG TPA: winged helix-turn-helix transcriptional regulator [Methanocella sp.]|nr:winged helix-turn-helix transcriptional regulator [Methanocella sp.]